MKITLDWNWARKNLEKCSPNNEFFANFALRIRNRFQLRKRSESERVLKIAKRKRSEVKSILCEAKRSEFASLRNFSQSCEFALRIWSPASNNRNMPKLWKDLEIKLGFSQSYAQVVSLRSNSVLISNIISLAVTSFIAKDGNEYDITPGCPEIWPQNTDPNTFLPPWTRECPPLDLCFTNTAYNRADAPDARCKDPNGNKANLESCCTDGYKKFSSCYRERSKLVFLSTFPIRLFSRFRQMFPISVSNSKFCQLFQNSVSLPDFGWFSQLRFSFPISANYP